MNPTCVVCENDFCPKCIDKNHTGLCCTECETFLYVPLIVKSLVACVRNVLTKIKKHGTMNR